MKEGKSNLPEAKAAATVIKSCCIVVDEEDDEDVAPPTRENFPGSFPHEWPFHRK